MIFICSSEWALWYFLQLLINILQHNYKNGIQKQHICSHTVSDRFRLILSAHSFQFINWIYKDLLIYNWKFITLLHLFLALCCRWGHCQWGKSEAWLLPVRISIMPEKDLVPRNVNQDTVQIHLSEERSLTTSLQVVSSVRIHTCQSLSLSLSLSLPFVSLSLFLLSLSCPFS